MKRENSVHQVSKKSYLKKCLLWFLVIAGVGIIIVAGFTYKNIRDSSNKIYTPVTDNDSHKRNLDALLQKKRPVNFLIIGLDTGALGRHWKGDSDTIMMMTLNLQKKQATVISIPRDSKVTLPDFSQVSTVKLKSVYQIGGVSEVTKVVKRYYNVPIDGYLLINLGGLEKEIDQIGGIKVKAPMTFSNLGYHFEKGKTYHLSGKATLSFILMSKTDPKRDYGRQDRNRHVLTRLIRNSFLSTTLLNNSFLTSVADELQSDLTLKQMMRLSLLYRDTTETVKLDQVKGTSRAGYAVISKKERRRVADELRTALEIDTIEEKQIKD